VYQLALKAFISVLFATILDFSKKSTSRMGVTASECVR